MNRRVLGLVFAVAIVVALVVGVSALTPKEEADVLKGFGLTEEQIAQVRLDTQEWNARIQQDPSAFANLLADLASKNQQTEEVPADRDTPAD